MFARALATRLRIDRTVTGIVGARIWNSASGIVTLALLVRRLTEDQQGRYYVLVALGAAQLFAELGLSYAITNLVSHEMGSVSFEEGRWSGPSLALGRLRSLLRFSMRWFNCSAAVFFLLVGVSGWVYLRSRFDRDASHALLAWLLYAFGIALYLVVEGRLAFLLGADNGPTVGRCRLFHAIASSILLWMGLQANFDLLSLGMSVAIPAAANLLYLTVRYRASFAVLCRESGPELSWRTEIFPFQWRLAVSFVAGLFGAQFIPVVVEAQKGATAAGKFGVSIQVVASLNAIAYTWMTTVCSRFGPLFANGEIPLIRQRFRNAFLGSALLVIVALVTVFGLRATFPWLANRMMPNLPFLWLCGIAVVNHLLFSLTALLRSQRSDPVWWTTVVQATVTLTLLFGIVSRSVFTGVIRSLLAGTVCAVVCVTAIAIQRRSSWSIVQPTIEANEANLC